MNSGYLPKPMEAKSKYPLKHGNVFEVPTYLNQDVDSRYLQSTYLNLEVVLRYLPKPGEGFKVPT